MLGDRTNFTKLLLHPGFRAVLAGVFVLAVLAITVPRVGRAALDTPQILSYQGRLTDAQKITVPDGSRSMAFIIYDDATGVLVSDCEWVAAGSCAAPGTVPITVTDGIFNVLLGAAPQIALPDALFDTTEERWLEIRINGETLTPRRRIVSSATALQAGNASLLDGFNTSQSGGTSAFVPVTDAGGQLTLSPGSVTNPTYSFVGDTNTGVYQNGADILSLVTAGADRIVAGAAGEIGIGAANDLGAGSEIFDELGVGTIAALSNIVYIGDLQGSIGTNTMLIVDPVASAISIANGTFLVDRLLTAASDAVFGTSAFDTLLINSTLQGASPLRFEGATPDAFETIFAITDPTVSDKTITFPNATGTVALTSDITAMDLDTVYDNDADKVLLVDSALDLEFELTASGNDFRVQSVAGGNYLKVLGSNGRLGLGLPTIFSAPAAALHVESSASGGDGVLIRNTAADGDPTVTFQLGGSSIITMGVDDSDSDKFKIGTTAVETGTYLTITTSGNVGIGTTSPSARLELDGTATRLEVSTSDVTNATIDIAPSAVSRLLITGVATAGSIFSDSVAGDITFRGNGGNAFRFGPGLAPATLFVMEPNGFFGINTGDADAFLDVDAAEDVEHIRLSDSTNADSAGVYVGDGTIGLDGTLTAQAGSIFLDEDGALWVNVNGATDWNQVAFAGAGGGGGWTDDGTVVRLTTITDNVGIGTIAPGAQLEVVVPSASVTQAIRGAISTYSGAGQDFAGLFENTATGTGTNGFLGGNGNFASFGVATGATTGDNVGLYGAAQLSTGRNFGVIGKANGVGASLAIGTVGYSGNATTNIGGFFQLQTGTLTEPSFTSAALMADNGGTTSPIFVARDNGTPVFTIADGGDSTLAPISGHTGDALTITGGSLANTKSGIRATVTMPSSGGVNETGFRLTATGAGTSGNQRGAEIALIAGYTGSGQTDGVNFGNTSAGTGAGQHFDNSYVGNHGGFGFSIGATTGTNVGMQAYGRSSTGLNIGMFGAADGGGLGSNNVGVGGYGLDAGGGGAFIGGYFTAGAATPTFTSAALIADNTAQAVPIFIARDNGTQVFTIANGGDSTLAPVSGHTGDALTITGGSLASTKRALLVTGTLSTTNASQVGAEFNITSPSTAGTITGGPIALSAGLNTGYTGTSRTIAGQFGNGVSGAGTGSWNSQSGQQGNLGTYALVLGATAGHNIGAYNQAFESSTLNVGTFGVAGATGTTGDIIGVVGRAINVGSNAKIGVFASLANADGNVPAALTTTALLADNDTMAASIFIARDNGTPVFTIADGGAVSMTGDLTVTGNILPGADDTYDLGSSTARWANLFLGPATLSIGTNGNDYGISFDTAGVGTLVFNETGTDTDVRIEGDTDANLFFADASTDRIGIGDSSPAALLTVGNGDLFEVTSAGNVVFQNNADHTISTTSSSGTPGRKLTISSGNGSGSGDIGGNLELFAGTSNDTTGGDVAIFGGTGSNGGLITLLGGAGGNSGDTGGAVTITGGLGNNNTGGDVSITSGASTGTTAGNVNIFTGAGTTTSGAVNINTALAGAGGSGNINIIPGGSAGGTAGSVLIDGGSPGTPQGTVKIGTQIGSVTTIGNDPTGNTAIKLDVDGLMRLNLRTATGANGPFALCHENDGTVDNEEIKDCNGAPTADYSEQYPVAGGIAAGDVVVASMTDVTTTDGDTIKQLVQSTVPYAVQLIGVVSDPTKSGDFNTIGYNIDVADNPMPIALVGRVKVKVNDSNGAIAVGDPITSSATAGIGMKATKPGFIIGRALSAWAGPGQGTVMVFVNTQYWVGSTITSSGSVTTIEGDLALGSTIADTITMNAGTESLRSSLTDDKFITKLSQLSVVGGVALDGNCSSGAAEGWIFQNDAGTQVGHACINASNQMSWYAESFNGTGTDVAESYNAKAGEVIQKGDVVALDITDPGDFTVTKATSANADMTLGIISTRPGVTLSGVSEDGKRHDNPRPVMVALAGRVPTKVTNQNGQISKGDLLTPSSTPGVAMKWTGSGPVIGRALKPLLGPTGTIEVFVKLESHPSQNIASETPHTTTQNFAIYGDLDFAGYSVTNIKAIRGQNWSIDEAGALVVNSVQTGALIIKQTDEVATMGEGVMKAGYDAMIVQNSQMHANSKVFMTWNDDPGSRAWVTTKGEGNFEVKLSTPALQDAHFDYWIVNVLDERHPAPVVVVPPPPAPDLVPSPIPDPAPIPEPVLTPEPVQDSSASPQNDIPDPTPVPDPIPAP